MTRLFSLFQVKAEREWQIQALANLEDGVPASSSSVLVTQGQYSSSEGDISPSSQSVGVGTLDMRSDLFPGPRASRSVSAENVDIVTNQTDGADSGAIPAPASALDFNEN